MARGFLTTYGAGTTDQINTTYAVDQTGQSTKSVWAFINSNNSGNGRIFTKALAQATNGIDQLATSAGPLIQYAHGFSTQLGLWATTTFPTTGVWTNICVTYDASSTSNVPVIYFNGVSQTVTTSTAPTGTPTTCTDPFVIGNNGTTPTTRTFDGMLAHFAIWSGVLLSASEIAQLARGVNPMSLRPDSLGCYLPLDGVNTPEPDLVNGLSSTVTGTRYGRSDPVVEPLYGDDDITTMLNSIAASGAISPYYYRHHVGGMHV